MSLSISVFGLGYVGSVSAACFASMGQRVIGVDVNPAKVEMMESGKSPIVEASMNELVAEGNRSCRLHATVDSNAAVLESDVSFVCVGTPSLRNGMKIIHVHASGNYGYLCRINKGGESVTISLRNREHAVSETQISQLGGFHLSPFQQ